MRAGRRREPQLGFPLQAADGMCGRRVFHPPRFAAHRQAGPVHPQLAPRPSSSASSSVEATLRALGAAGGSARRLFTGCAVNRHALAARGEAGTAESSDGGLHPRQETGSGFDGGGCRTDHLLLDFGAADIAALTLRVGRAEFCHFVEGNFTKWCECERRGGGGGEGGRDARDMRSAPDQASSSQGPVLTPSTSIDAKAGSGRGFVAAIVIKGPLLPFTEDVIAHYATTLPSDVAVVFSHTNGPCFTAARLQTLRHLARVHPNFEWTINAAPPSDGANYRNVQRESTYYGVRFAAEALGARDVLMQRADSVFQNASRLFSDLRRVRDALPPPTVPMPGGRVGLCPTQMQLTDTYGRFHLDDHCMFGSAEALLYFWAVDNVFYDRRAEAWSSAAMGNARRGCKLPAVESDNGFIWVRDGLARRGMPPPQSTRDLIAQRAFILNAAAWGHVCRRRRTNQRLHLPVDPDKFNVLSPEIVGRAAPLGVYAQCTAREFTYDCAGVGDDVQARTDTPRWACSASNTHC